MKLSSAITQLAGLFILLCLCLVGIPALARWSYECGAIDVEQKILIHFNIQHEPEFGTFSDFAQQHGCNGFIAKRLFGETIK